MAESRRTELVKRTLTRDIFDKLKGTMPLTDERAIGKLFDLYRGDVKRVITEVSKKFDPIKFFYLRPANKYPDVGYYFDLELKPADVTKQKLDIQIVNWRLTDYAQGYDEDFANFAQSKGQSHEYRGGKPYTIQPGDSLWKISREVYGRGSFWNEIYKNNIHLIGENPNYIFEGIQLEIPTLLVPNYEVNAGAEERPLPTCTSQKTSKKLGSPTASVELFSEKIPLRGVVGPKHIYTGSATLTGELKIQDSKTVTNPQSIKLDAYKKKISSTLKFLGTSFTVETGNDPSHLISVGSTLFKNESFEISMSTTGPKTVTGKLDKKGLKFQHEGFHFELNLNITIELRQLDKPDDVQEFPLVPVLLVAGSIALVFVFGRAAVALIPIAIALPAFAGSKDFSELQNAPELWEKAKREFEQLRL